MKGEQHGTTTTTQANAAAHGDRALSQAPRQTPRRQAPPEMTDEAKAAWHRLIELTGVDGKSGTIAAIQFEHARSAASQGTRIGELETEHRALEQRVDAIELARASEQAETRSTRRVWAVLGAVGLLAIGAVLSELAKLLSGG